MINDYLREEHLGIKKIHFNRKGNSVLPKTHWDLLRRTEFFSYCEIMGKWKMLLTSLLLNIFKLQNINKLLFRHLIRNSIRNKYDFFCEKVKDFIDLLLVSESKMHSSFPLAQFISVKFLVLNSGFSFIF